MGLSLPGAEESPGPGTCVTLLSPCSHNPLLPRPAGNSQGGSASCQSTSTLILMDVLEANWQTQPRIDVLILIFIPAKSCTSSVHRVAVELVKVEVNFFRVIYGSHSPEPSEMTDDLA